MSNSNIPKGPYYIGYKDNMYKVDPVIFAQHSGKFARDCLIQRDHMEFNEVVSDETFKAFLSSCQLRNFQLQPLYALELLDVARKWDCPNLERYCQDLCKENGIVYRPKNDVLGNLLKNIDEGTAKRSDLQAVANVFDEVMDDDRLPDVEPEILFRIVLMAEKKGFDMEKYIKFVMRIIKTEPETAILLILRINFDLLPEDQENYIFHCPMIHEQSINFFVAMALSSVRWHARTELEATTNYHIDLLNDFLKNIEVTKANLIKQLADEHDEQMDEIMTVLEKQHAIIEDLSDILAEQAQKLETGPLSVNGQGDERVNKIRHDAENDIRRYTEAVNDQLNENRARFMNNIEETIENVKNEWIKNMTDPVRVKEAHEKKLNEIDQQCNKQQQQLDQIQGEVDTIKATLLAKIVKDKLQGARGIRDTTNAYDVFDGAEKIWNLSSDDVKRAERDVIDVIEHRIEAECPMRAPVMNDD
ncbi:hypothetical protein TVAG_266360 [Trichomonas vaginalis G3]|uniref:Uncharacterized protein n=1 Tax=Trichomonas vaginalis (strain ATCC PRA-98 / G3) TaxID=412133 RepID=A2DQI9_TRIV3|nr:ankyrin repeat domain-containing protein 49 family [Trichomonas vaginalis G3]EAY17273.1 hypothetical protein TVAG_266360 [Trichomonas vaginalis G3]KAI5523265.1 ankyrin repeat domain-containing protein 49 family [Trichomonas vaginalis G3]|eukprot:XP_001329496.1 hypothetical protein [Trichomonas vaginalis G3]